MSIIRAIKHRLGLSVTPANNFVWDASADNGTCKLARESGQDIMTVDAAGKVAFNSAAFVGPVTVNHNSTYPLNVANTVASISLGGSSTGFGINGSAVQGSSPFTRFFLGTYNSLGDTSLQLTRGNGTENWTMRAGAQGATDSLIFSFTNTDKAEVPAATGAWSPISSIRFKENVQDAPHGLSEVLRLRPVKFDYKTGGTSLGFIAEEVDDVIPIMVNRNEANEVTSLSETMLISVLVKAIQELSAKVAALEAKQ